MSSPPSGMQVELRFGEQRAVVVEVGGGLREYTVAGRPVLDGYAEGERCRSGRGQILAPWPNRLRDGRYEWEGETHQLALSEVARHNAIHGLVRFANWNLAGRSAASATMTHVLHPQDGYPFSLALQAHYALDEAGLTVTTTAINVGKSACPYGIGAHPYLTLCTDTIDDCTLQVPAATWMPSDERGIPTGEVALSGGDQDFRSPRRIGQAKLDVCCGELRREHDGRAYVVLSAPAGGRSVSVWMDEQHRYLMLFTGDTLPDPQQRRRALAIEPMTCAPDAFNSGAGLHTLEPGQSLLSRWGIASG